jgi:hypothetical protein
MSGLNVVNDQNLFNDLAKNHHVVIRMHYPLALTTFTGIIHYHCHLRVQLARLHVNVNIKLPLQSSSKDVRAY